MDYIPASVVPPKMRVGFIGLGLMGKPMAGHILQAGYPLTVHNRSRAAVDELVERGAQAAASPREVAANSDVVITMLPDSPDVEAVINGTEGILAGARPGLIHVDLSTISATATRRTGGLRQSSNISGRETALVCDWLMRGRRCRMAPAKPPSWRRTSSASMISSSPTAISW